MATVWRLLPNFYYFESLLQERADIAENRRNQRYKAVVVLQRMTRGYLIRKHVKRLHHNVLIIQCAWRRFIARRRFNIVLKRALRSMHAKYYDENSTIVQALWRGFWSRKTKFCLRLYRQWLQAVTERGERRSAECAEFTLRSRADDLKILENEARQWLAYVVFKIHHLLRTYSVAGVYSDSATHELSEFEKLLFAIRYTDYMRKLRLKYEEFVKKHRPQFSNKRLFPIIGDGSDYWYLSLPEMYEISKPKVFGEKRHIGTHHGKIHKEPFLWRKVRPPPPCEGRGPFTPAIRSPKRSLPPAPAPTPIQGGDSASKKDPRFYLYVKYYKPEPKVMDYIDYHINLLLRRRCSIQNMELEKYGAKSCKPRNYPEPPED